jgi:hypothetical protein
MKKAFLGIFFSLLASCAGAFDLYVAPPPLGVDTNNNCQNQATPCATGQHAVDQTTVGSGVAYNIYFAAGQYSGEIDIAYWRNINLRGTNCSNVLATVLKPTANGTSIVTAQDGAIVGVNCLTLDGTGFTGTNGLYSRQLAILDFRYVGFFSMGGQHITANFAAINCTAPTYIWGGATVHASAGNQAVLTMSCQENIMNPVSFAYYTQAGLQSVTNWSGASFTNSGYVSGGQYTAQDGSCVACRAVPGSGFSISGSGTVW